jgi:hypothetical protein
MRLVSTSPLTSDVYLTYDGSDLFPNHRLIRYQRQFSQSSLRRLVKNSRDSRPRFFAIIEGGRNSRLIIDVRGTPPSPFPRISGRACDKVIMIRYIPYREIGT